ncbi:hypothetical protein Hanom_Chr11g01037931 [Helianthus anomalus]
MGFPGGNWVLMELAQGGAGRCGQMDRDYLLNTYDVSNINTYDWVFTLMLPYTYLHWF